MASNKGPNQRYSTPNRSADSSFNAMGEFASNLGEKFKEAKKAGLTSVANSFARLSASVSNQQAALLKDTTRLNSVRKEHTSAGASPKSTADWVGRPTIKK